MYLNKLCTVNWIKKIGISNPKQYGNLVKMDVIINGKKKLVTCTIGSSIKTDYMFIIDFKYMKKEWAFFPHIYHKYMNEIP